MPCSGELVEVALDVPLMDLGAVHTITHPNRRPAAKTRAWMNFLAEVIPPMAFIGKSLSKRGLMGGSSA